jgi:hypothetical protein
MIQPTTRTCHCRTCPSAGAGCRKNCMHNRSARSLTSLALVFAVTSAAAACDQSGSAVTPPDNNAGGTTGNQTTGPAPEAPLKTPHACGARIKELAVFQAVKVPLVVDGQPVASLTAPLIANRRAYFRAYVAFDDATNGNPIAGFARARLRLGSSQGTQEVAVDAYIGQESTEGQIDSTINFDVPANLMQGDVHVGVDLELGTGCNGGSVKSYPPNGLLTLPLQDTGTMKVTLVPVAYDADSSGRLPDLNPMQIESYRTALLAYYPVADVAITVREPVHSDIALTAGGGWGMFLDAVAAQRTADKVPADVHYYALVSPAASFRAYCSKSCIAGLSYLADVPSARKQVGAGIGFTGSDAGDTMVHELGHQHGRGHAPCGATDGLDAKYPSQGDYAMAGLGSWGLDFRSGKFQSPTRTKDMMSYCSPIWISDYNYGLLADRRLAIQAASARVVDAPTAESFEKPAFQGFRSLLARPDGHPVWGRPLVDHTLPMGTPEIAKARDAKGNVVAEVTVYRTSYGDGPTAGASIEVPTPAAGWASLEVAGQAPISFALAPAVPALRAH